MLYIRSSEVVGLVYELFWGFHPSFPLYSLILNLNMIRYGKEIFKVVSPFVFL